MYTMSTTVRIRDEDKRVLDRLQARITLETGEKLPLEEVLHRVVSVAEAHAPELTIDDTPPDLSEERKEEIASMGVHTGVRTREEDIDDILYGGPEGPA